MDFITEAPPVRESATRPLYWSVRRELWENRSLTLAPLIVAAVVLFSWSATTIRLARKVRALAALDPNAQYAAAFKPFSLAASVILFTGILVGAFYCLDALYGERRDRSILFWKSLPVSDVTTVLSKALIPIVILPLFTIAVALTTQTIMLLLGSVALLFHGVNPALLWTRVPLVQESVVMFYGVAAHALWYAPLYAWMLLLSAWAKRAVLLWVVLPSVAINVVEKGVFGTSHFASLVKYRLIGALHEAFAVDALKKPVTGFSQLEIANFLTTPGLWAGLVFAAVCLAAAVRLRRNREPI
ncbi:MAG TPA: ABC transporter permease [Thermoanaerobaculia bacterium]|jgi:ABC-2 type transport system permease protein